MKVKSGLCYTGYKAVIAANSIIESYNYTSGVEINRKGEAICDIRILTDGEATVVVSHGSEWLVEFYGRPSGKVKEIYDRLFWGEFTRLGMVVGPPPRLIGIYASRDQMTSLYK